VAVAALQVPNAFAQGPLYSVKGLFVYASCFAGGVLVAAYDLPARWGRGAMVAGIVYSVLAFRWSALNVHVGWGLVCLGLVIVALDEDTWPAHLLSRWPVVWLGERSYSLFLLHYSVFTAVNHVVSLLVPHKGLRYYLITRGVEIPLTMLAAMAVFVLVEKRFARNLVTAGSFWPVRPPGWHDGHAAGEEKLQAAK
jgi:peptidoglycan/LPS O-acetylase OafA/YrhL